MWKKNKFRILGGILIMSIGLNITGCSNGKSGNDNENVNKNKSYSEVALETLEERYGEPFELRQAGGTFGATRNTKKLICNPVSNPNTYCFVEVESDKTEVHDDYANRIMEERYAVMLEEEAKKIFNEELNVKVSLNPFYDRYQYLDMEPMEFYKDNVHSHYMIYIFINSDGNIDKVAEAEKMLKFAEKVLELGMYKTSGVRFLYCKKETYDDVDNSFYNADLNSSTSAYKYYAEENRIYTSKKIGIEDKKIEEEYNSVEKLIDEF